MSEQRSHQVNVIFTGKGLQALGWGLLYGILYSLIIPAAWGAVALLKWFARNLSFSDGTQASFGGRGKEVWGYFAILVLLSYGSMIASAAAEDKRFIVSIILGIVLLPINAAICLKIIRWFFTSVKLSCGTNLSFKGSYGPYLGWMLLVTLSVYTIIGWAWASVAMLRWVCRNIEGGQNEVVFVGSGWGLLWRCFVAGLASIVIIPIPWMAVWIIRWFARNMIVQRATV